jgi:hypothetical protein
MIADKFIDLYARNSGVRDKLQAHGLQPSLPG